MAMTMEDGIIATSVGGKNVTINKQPSGRDFLSALPAEILHIILGYLPADYPRRGGLASCCTTNKRIGDVATGLLYYNLVLRYREYSGFLPHVVEALFQYNHQSLKHVRAITLEAADGMDSLGVDLSQTNLVDDIVEGMGVILRCLFQRIDSEKIIFINTDCLRIVSYLPEPVRKKITRLECSVTFNNSIGSLRTQDELDSNFEDSSVQYVDSLQYLKVKNLEHDLSNFYPAWLLCHANWNTLRSLALASPREKSRTIWNPTPNQLAQVFEQFRDSPDIDYIVPCEGAEEISLENLHSLNDVVNAFYILISPKCVQTFRKFKMIGCYKGMSFMATLTGLMPALTHLTLIDCDVLDNTEAAIANLPASLQSLHLRGAETPGLLVPLLRKETLQRHSQTLRKLWLDVRRQSNIANRFQTTVSVEFPLNSEKGDDSGSLDVETISRFPKLEYLALSVALPSDMEKPHRDAPTFPSLRLMYFLNYGISGSDPELFYLNWYNWFTRPYTHNIPSRTIPPPAVAMKGFQDDSLDFPLRNFQAFFKSLGKLQVFDQKADVRFWDPDAADFLDQDGVGGNIFQW
ncbi:hypothetical protein ABW19_dt0202649 [Dactylella cylindrospora]|nr:hypothetical protein ABW19_dt0202649 [Dactylella cylindrospora]